MHGVTGKTSAGPESLQHWKDAHLYKMGNIFEHLDQTSAEQIERKKV